MSDVSPFIYLIGAMFPLGILINLLLMIRSWNKPKDALGDKTNAKM